MVSQGLPRLWDRVVLATTSIADVRTASIMRHLLARSGNLPLSLSIRNMSWPWVILRDGSTLFFDILWESHSRLQHVTLEIPHKSARVAPRNKQFPLLALLSLTLLGDTEEGDSDVIALLNSFRHAPALRSLDLVSEQKVVASFAQSPFPWSRLRDLRLRMAITLLDARTILVQCHRLERARISVGRRLEEFSPGISTLPNLRELYFAIPDDGPSAAFFEAFAFPNVERLAIDVGELSIEAFQGFYTRSNFSLQHLHLERIDDMMVDDLLAFLRVMPTLRTLSVINCGCCIEPGLFEIFTHHPIPSERAIGLPKLTKLLLGLDFDMDGTSVADMAESLSQHRGRDSEFPDLEVVYLMTYSRDPFARYEEAVETRLAAVAETDFLQREISPAPANITEYTDEDWELWM
ncbi:hypothetical protein C8R44DRAFT_761532 [Mycena epipterygia]|nr:hypothetical protein C8R44DRAFT_761532 [Mycena epipterygia]